MSIQPSRTRKFVGACLLLIFVVVYALLAMWLGSVLINHWGAGAQILYYAIAGLAWTVPAYWIMKWMSKPAG